MKAHARAGRSGSSTLDGRGALRTVRTDDAASEGAWYVTALDTALPVCSRADLFDGDTRWGCRRQTKYVRRSETRPPRTVVVCDLQIHAHTRTYHTHTIHTHSGLSTSSCWDGGPVGTMNKRIASD